MQVVNKKTYVIYPVYASREIAYGGTTFTRSELTPVDVEIAGIPMPGMHSVPMTVWELDEGFSSNLSQYFTTAEDMWLYLENLGFDRQTIKNYNFHYLPYKTPTLAKGWLDTNAYKDKMEELAPQVQYYPADSLLYKSQTSALVPNLYIENTVWGGYIGLCPRSASQASQVWGTERLQFFNITDSPADTDPLVSAGQRAIPPIIATGPIGTNNYSVGPKYAGISSSQANRTGVSIPILYKAPIPSSPNNYYYGVILYGYRYNDNRYFLYTKAFGYIASTTYSYTVYSTTQADMHLTTEQIDAFFNEAAEYVPGTEWSDDDTALTGDGDNPYEGHENDTSQGGDGDYTGATGTTDSASYISGIETAGTTAGLHLYALTDSDIAEYQNTRYKYIEARKDSLLFSSVYQELLHQLQEGFINLYAVPFDLSSIKGTAVSFISGNVGVLTTASQPTDLSPSYVQVSPLTKSVIKLSDITLPTVNCYYGSFLDYEPFTTFRVFIPYFGDVQVEASKVYGHTLTLSYRVDLLTGDFLCILMSDGFQLNAVSGNLAYKIQMVLNDPGTLTQQMARGIARTVLAATPAAPIANVSMNTAEQTTANVPAHIDVIGQGMGGNIGWMGSQYPYITRNRAIVSVPKKYEKLEGMPLFMSSRLDAENLKGTHVKVDNIHIRCSATAEEKDEILRKLREGVVL